ncbi:DUF4192 domain-containing protein [Glutamicibacter sp.]|uniref:DUF4192 domain-containing protein n=1 Tax=Glutamicibacter sp. TaxID=1931995 RepID=UPI0028BEDDA7|nr:DUF4192 domain-containing protein [Glutamicibacter sp.]
MTTTPERQPLSLSDIEDILAYIPHALGFQPSNSMVLLLIDGKRLEATLRVDLPDEASASKDLDSWLRQVTNLAGQLPGIQSVISVAFVPEVVGEHEQAPLAELHERLEAHLSARQIGLQHSWCVDDTSVWDYDAPGWNKAKPRPSTLSNATNLSMVLAGSAPLQKPWDGCGIPPWPNAREVFDRSKAPGAQKSAGLVRWAELLNFPVDRALIYLHSDPDCAVELLRSLHWKVVRDLLPYLAGTDQDATLKIFNILTERKQGEAVPELSNFLLGRGWRSPDWQRTERLWAVARDLLGVAQGNQRYALLCVLAWIEWARGRGSLAMTLLEQVLRECEDYNLAVLLKQLLMSGVMPYWATDQLRAWRAQFV